MRHFYLFDINNKLINISNNDYNLYRFFSDIYYSDKSNYKVYDKIYYSVIKPINKKVLNNSIFNTYKTNLFYTKFKNNHYYNNYLDREETRITINNSFIRIDSNNIKPAFIKYLSKYSNLFVCDFDNNDYFFLESVALS
jgi:hypothetical protein